MTSSGARLRGGLFVSRESVRGQSSVYMFGAILKFLACKEALERKILRLTTIKTCCRMFWIQQNVKQSSSLNEQAPGGICSACKAWLGQLPTLFLHASSIRVPEGAPIPRGVGVLSHSEASVDLF